MNENDRREKIRKNTRPAITRLVNVWDDTPANGFAVLVPVLAILLVALFLVSQLAMDQEHGKVDWVKVWKGARQT